MKRVTNQFVTVSFVVVASSLAVGSCKRHMSTSNTKSDKDSTLEVGFHMYEDGVLSLNHSRTAVEVTAAEFQLFPSAPVTKQLEPDSETVEFDVEPAFSGRLTVRYDGKSINCENQQFAMDIKTVRFACSAPLSSNQGTQQDQSLLNCECVGEFDNQSASQDKKLQFAVKSEDACFDLIGKKKDIENITYKLSACKLRPGQGSQATPELVANACSCHAIDNSIEGDAGSRLTFDLVKGKTCESLNHGFQSKGPKFYLVNQCQKASGATNNPPSGSSNSPSGSTTTDVGTKPCSCQAINESVLGSSAVTKLVSISKSKECSSLDNSFQFYYNEKYLMLTCKPK